MSEIIPYYMHQSGAISGVPGPNGGLWPGGIIVYVDADTNSVVSTSLIGGQPAEAGEAEQQNVPPPQEAPVQIQAPVEVSASVPEQSNNL